MHKVLMTAAAVVMLAMPTLAQDADDQKPAPSKNTVSEKKADDQKAAEAPKSPGPQPTSNIRVDLKIVDQRGEGVALSKTMSMTVTDGAYGRLRTTGDVRTPMGSRPVILNVDANPRIMRDGKVNVMLSIEYRPIAAEAETEKSTTPGLNESITVLLEDGKSTVISQSADPATDRKVQVEAKVTIIR